MTINENVSAAIEKAMAGLVEIPGETREARFTRIRKISVRLEDMTGCYQPWSDEAKALSGAIGKVFAFRSWGTK